jgi:hypothetical protein
MASTTAKPSMILARNRRVGSLKDEPPRFRNRTSSPVFVLKSRHREAPPPYPVGKLKAEWIRVRKSGQSWQRWAADRAGPARGAPGCEEACASKQGGGIGESCSAGRWSLILAMSGLRDRPPVTHPAIAVPPLPRSMKKNNSPGESSARAANVITMTGSSKILVASSGCAVSNWNNYKTLGRYHACLQSS